MAHEYYFEIGLGGQMSPAQPSRQELLTAIDAKDQEIARLTVERNNYRTLAGIGVWHAECRPNRAQAARELEKSQAVINKLADTITTLRTMTWQPIATAPKDGTVIFGFNGRMATIEWSGDAWNLAETHDYPEDTRWEYPPPTHWMPLPDPPTVDATPASEAT